MFEAQRKIEKELNKTARRKLGQVICLQLIKVVGVIYQFGKRFMANGDEELVRDKRERRDGERKRGREKERERGR